MLLTCKVVYEVFDEVANDGIKNAKHNEDSHKKVKNVGGQVDCIPGGWYVAFKEHGPVLFFETNLQAIPRHLHCCPTVAESAVGAESPPNTCVSLLSR